MRQVREILAAAKNDEFDPQAEWWFRVAEEKGGETQREQIDAVLAGPGIAATEPSAISWHRLSGAQKAHRPGLRVRPVDAEFEQPLASVVTNAHAAQTGLSHDPPNVERSIFTAYQDTTRPN